MSGKMNSEESQTIRYGFDKIIIKTSAVFMSAEV